MHHTNHLIIAVGLPHGGQHAMMEWLLPQEEIIMLVNDVTGEPPILDKGRHPDLSCITESDLLIISFEHDTPETIRRHADQIQFTRWEKRTFMLMIRDPLNFLASTIQHWRNLERTNDQIDSVLRNVIRSWKDLAREFVGDTSFISDHEKICVNFNLWFCDYSYRQMISKIIGTRFTDETRNQLATTGGWVSSSFDGRSYAGRATDMKVLHRWEKFRKDKQFLEFFDEEMKELGHRIYGPWMPVLK